MPSGVANPRGNTAGQYSFAQVPSVGLQRSVFNRSCNLKTAFNSGDLIPCFLDEVLPGDTMKMRMTLFARMQRPVVPLMDNLYLDVFFFAVPNRLVWDNWHKFCGAQDDPGDSVAFTIPRTQAFTCPEGNLYDYLGVPIDTANDITVNILPARCYALIYNEWFRDENLQDSIHCDTGDGPESPSLYTIWKRGKRHDYFTSCLPWTQKGTAIGLPLGSTAPVVAEGSGVPTFDYSDITGAEIRINSETGNVAYGSGDPTADGQPIEWNDTALEVDLASATAATINEIREAFQVQRLLERDARAGTRLTEVIRSHFHVVSPDARMQRPEFLGGGSCRVQVAPVASTDSAAGAPGDLGSFAVAGTNQPSFYKSFTEHCYVLGLVNVRADLTYQQGLPRLFRRSSRYDFYWPSLAHLGEQAVLNEEIYCDGSANDALTFGFQERYSEYRYKPSSVTGAMRSTAATPLDYWHLGLDFDSLPVLNTSFIQDAPPLDRVVAVTDEPEFFMDAHFEYKCARPMPTFSVPGMIDHF